VTADFDRLLKEIRSCRLCAGKLKHEPRPVLRVTSTARICIAGQAPGTRVHKSGVPFTDPSGDRLRDWLGIDAETFYDDRYIAVVPMGFCFPGLDAQGGDLPPRKECAPQWREKVFANLPNLKLMLPIGLYAQNWHLKGKLKANMTDTVKAWRDYGPNIIPLPHPSWRNNAWLKKNAWFEAELLPHLRRRVSRILKS
jgi:uracil-DNA glycosylase